MSKTLTHWLYKASGCLELKMGLPFRTVNHDQQPVCQTFLSLLRILLASTSVSRLPRRHKEWWNSRCEFHLHVLLLDNRMTIETLLLFSLFLTAVPMLKMLL